MHYKRGDIFTVDLTGAIGSEQAGVRPCIIVSNDLCNRYSSVVTIIPVTAQTNKMRLPTHYQLDHKKYSLDRPSFAIAEQITSVDKERFIRREPKSLDKADLARLEEVIKVQVGISS
jgi:mRNA interferase MazF